MQLLAAECKPTAGWNFVFCLKRFAMYLHCTRIDSGLTLRLLGTWVKYNQHYFYLYRFFEELTTAQTRRQIFTHDGSNDAD